MVMNKRLITGYLVIVIGILVVGLIVYYFQNTTILTIKSENVSSTTVKRDGNFDVSKSDDSFDVRVFKHSITLISYEGAAGFSHGETNIKVGESKKDVSISPYFSTERLRELAENEKDSVIKAINSSNSKMSGYKIVDYKLYHFGDWASAQLDWRGDYEQNTDSLRVILNKKSNRWVVLSYPQIVYFSENYPEIPEDILESVNKSAL